MKNLLYFVLLIVLSSCAELNQIVNVFGNNTAGSSIVSNLDISNALKQTLEMGITDEVKKLTIEKGFYNNPLVKIGYPAELKKVEEGLRKYGFNSLADQGLLALNATAEDAVKTATPIFIDAIRNMSITDAKKILMGSKDAATIYLQQSTNNKLYQAFNPVIKTSFQKVGADKVWSSIIVKYNSLPLVTKVNPDLVDYVANQSLNGIYKMVAIKEENIRTNLSSRSSVLLQKVFALQD